MKWWRSYKQLVERNTLNKSSYENRVLSFWRDKLFTTIVLYLLPVSFLALIPGVIMSFIGQIPLLALYDIITVVIFAIIALHPTLRLSTRKIGLVVCLYLLSIILLFYLGSFGPGLLYMLALTVFTALIFPVSIARWAVIGNLVICILFSFFIHFRLLNTSIVQQYSLGSWIAVSSNLVILSVVIVASIHLLFTGLQATIAEESKVRNQLEHESMVLEKTLQTMEIKNAELEQFAYIASHDLQEPLTAISNVVTLFDKQYQQKLDTTSITYLSFLTESASRMQAMIKGLLDYSRIGKESEVEFIDANLLLREVLIELQELISVTNTSISADNLPSLYGYRMELKQMFGNLISNAIKFRKPDVLPQITIKSSEEKNQYVFSVKDNGIGIEERFTKKIFLIFQRLHTKSKYAGTGVGLAQCKRIATLHGGKIWVDSIPAQGSIFYFTLSKDINSYGNQIKTDSSH